MKFEFCWEHRECDRLCPVKESQSIFCWRIARTEKLCHPDTCAQCSYRQNWFSNEYSLKEFIEKNDRQRNRRVSKRILAVDDEPNFLYALEETVLAEGYNCLTAIDGEEGLFFAREAPPDLIITDVMMPKVNGYELCRAVKADSRTKHIPIIVVSVRSSQKDIDEGMDAGADVYLVKPFQSSELEGHIKTLISSP
jgi:PleD family two-component response regulator